MVMRQTPFFTVGLMTYNNAGFIEKAIDSVLHQSFNNWELVISDDNSTDNTEEIVEKYVDFPQIRYIKHEKNLGQANNWNYLISNANGCVFATLHADDFWSPVYLEVAYTFFLKNKSLDILQFNWKVIDAKGGFLYFGPIKKDAFLKGKRCLEKQLLLYSTLPSTTLFKLNFARNVRMPDEVYKYAVDFDFFIRLFACSTLVIQSKHTLVSY